ncbi:predicted protein [Histoplasma capsulatum var. duboisii H88]|uniref:Predicted protein n=1 Tax=Ajellomyces capsulatus (strain H88) TaxID=544711 RepID=F0UNH0_AJEC8|nr:predicted protein [Histoplasma capsulatum var. duboisii H88]
MGLPYGYQVPGQSMVINPSNPSQPDENPQCRVGAISIDHSGFGNVKPRPRTTLRLARCGLKMKRGSSLPSCATEALTVDASIHFMRGAPFKDQQHPEYEIAYRTRKAEGKPGPIRTKLSPQPSALSLAKPEPSHNILFLESTPMFEPPKCMAIVG